VWARDRRCRPKREGHSERRSEEWAVWAQPVDAEVPRGTGAAGNCAHIYEGKPRLIRFEHPQPQPTRRAKEDQP
jgi:hypothetical protein